MSQSAGTSQERASTVSGSVEKEGTSRIRDSTNQAHRYIVQKGGEVGARSHVRMPVTQHALDA